VADRLLAAGHLPLVVRLRDREPVALTVKRALVPDLGRPELAPLRDMPLDAFLTQVNRRLGRCSLRILLDQFEEFFIRLAPEQRRGVVEDLNACLDRPDLDVRWVLLLRGEYLYWLVACGPRAGQRGALARLHRRGGAPGHHSTGKEPKRQL
jgi:hypothetical protein